MQNKFLLASAVLAGSAVASPLNLARQIAGYGSPVTAASAVHTSVTPSGVEFLGPSGVILGGIDRTSPTSTRAAVHASVTPHASYAPNTPVVSGLPSNVKPISDGYGQLMVGEASLIFCPISKEVTVNQYRYLNQTHLDSYTTTLKCPMNGAEYEYVSNMTSGASPMQSTTNPMFMVHGGNLCTSNLAQYYLWSSRMYTNLWALWGAMPIDVSASDYCETAKNGSGEVFRCVVPANPGRIEVANPYEASHSVSASYMPTRPVATGVSGHTVATHAPVYSGVPPTHSAPAVSAAGY